MFIFNLNKMTLQMQSESLKSFGINRKITPLVLKPTSAKYMLKPSLTFACSEGSLIQAF